ncbi:MAG: hypothetical protein AAF492_22940, partial [Verrucomicrobiota bacterium]
MGLQVGVVGLITTTAFAGEHVSLRLSDEPIPLLAEDQLDQPEPVFELGDSYLATGEVDKGFKLPTGAVWQPSFMAYGTFRTALQHFEEAGEATSEWANRLDLHANLQLSGTERINIGFRPFDHEGEFSGYRFDGEEEGWVDEFDG